MITLIPLVLMVDSASVAVALPSNQLLANLLMFAAFIWLVSRASGRLRELMLYGVLIALAGEVLFSLVFGMYEYRLENIPLYVPPGHSVVYAGVYYFVREPWVLRNRRVIEPLFLIIAIVYGLFWLFYDHDLYGILCLGVLLLLYQRYPKSRLFMMSMFILVAYLEQLGTRLGCWYWPEIGFDRFDWLPSGNPPSAISVFYFAFDILCVKLYLRLHRPVKYRLKRVLALSDA